MEANTENKSKCLKCGNESLTLCNCQESDKYQQKVLGLGIPVMIMCEWFVESPSFFIRFQIE